MVVVLGLLTARSRTPSRQYFCDSRSFQLPE